MSFFSKGENIPVPSVERDLLLKNSKGWLGFLLYLATVFVAQPTFAQEYLSDEWQFTVAPYLWGLELDGDLGFGGNRGEVKMGFDDILDDLNVAIMFDIEARKNRWGFVVNTLYSQTESSSHTSFLQDTLFLGQTYKVNTEIDLFITSVSSYVATTAWGLGISILLKGESRLLLIVDVMTGARYTYPNVAVDLDRKSGIPIPELPANISDDDDVDWIDPYSRQQGLSSICRLPGLESGL